MAHQMEQLFKKFDKDGDGYITAQEVHDFTKEMGDHFEDSDIEEMMKAADHNANGKIDMRELFSLISQITKRKQD
ncbi:MAG: EF-hand domain-containing protein, partial [Candidatus Kariarchaeaceae archaeon]|jgi:calmodulin